MKGKTIILAGGISLAIHAGLAVGLALCLAHAPAPRELPSLDLSRVDLSFAEEESETASVAPLPPAVPPSEIVPRESPPPPAPVPEEKRPPPELSAEPDFPEPIEETAPVAPPAPAVAPRQAKIDAPARPRRKIRPDYPRGARERGEKGFVTVEIAIDANGRVARAAVVTSSGYPELDAAALRAVRKADFDPAKSDGRPVASSTCLTLQFKLK